MSLLVLKFGGTSLANTYRITKVADIIVKNIKQGNQVIVVVSAMAGVTNELVGYAKEVNCNIKSPNYDHVISAGEQITSGLLALNLESKSIKARAILGWQLPITTDNNFSNATIKNIELKHIEECLKNNIVPIIAGFQGITENGFITTLGRGGSDTTAVAIAAAIKAKRCDIYTDVDGIYTADPRIVSLAKKLDLVSYEEMLEMSSLGAKVLHNKSVEIAMQNNLTLQVLSSFSENSGTFVVFGDKLMDKNIVTSVASSLSDASFTIKKVEENDLALVNIFSEIAKNNINIDMIIKAENIDNSFDLTFTVPKEDVDMTTSILEKNRSKIKFSEIICHNKLAKVSIIGVAMQRYSGIASKMFEVLAKLGIKIMAISTSEIKISVLIAEEHMERAVIALHSEFGLDSTALPEKEKRTK